MNDPKVNDGNGLFDAFGLIDSLIEDCNSLPKDLIDNQFIKFGLRLGGMAQKLNELKKGVQQDLESRDNQIRHLQRFINDLNDGEAIRNPDAEEAKQDE